MKINVTPQQIVDAIKLVHGGNISGPTDITETDEDIFFHVSFFGAALKVLCSKQFGTINSSPFNRDFVAQACSINSTYKPNESTTPPTPTSTSSKPSLIFATPQQIVTALTTLFGGNVQGPTDITETDDSLYFHVNYFGTPLRAICNKQFGTINSSPENRNFIAQACSINLTYKKQYNAAFPSPKQSLIFATPQQIVDAIKLVHGGNISGPTDITETNDDIFFHVSFFGAALKVFCNKQFGTISSSPENRDFVAQACSINSTYKKQHNEPTSTSTPTSASTSASTSSKPSLIVATPQQIVTALTTLFGGNVQGPTDITETDDSLYFHVSYFGTPLRVICNKQFGTINSSPENRNFIAQACSINSTYRKQSNN